MEIEATPRFPPGRERCGSDSVTRQRAPHTQTPRRLAASPGGHSAPLSNPFAISMSMHGTFGPTAHCIRRMIPFSAELIRGLCLAHRLAAWWTCCNPTQKDTRRALQNVCCGPPKWLDMWCNNPKPAPSQTVDRRSFASETDHYICVLLHYITSPLGP